MLIFFSYYSEKQRKAKKLFPVSLWQGKNTCSDDLKKPHLFFLARVCLSEVMNSYKRRTVKDSFSLKY